MKSHEITELKVYEKFGVKKFKEIVLKIRDILATLFLPGDSKQEKIEKIRNKNTNYNIGNVSKLDNVKKYKNKIFFNAGLHILSFILCLPTFSKMILGTASVFSSTVITICAILNVYCIMLQRYNYIRVSDLEKRMAPREERKKEKIKKEIKLDDSLFLDHTYKISDKKDRCNFVSIDELIENASLDELKLYRAYLLYYKFVEENKIDDENVQISLPITKNKTLKLEYKNYSDAKDNNK